MTLTQTIKRGDRYDFRWSRTDEFIWQLTLTDESDTAVDLTGIDEVILVARQDSSDTEASWDVVGSLVGSDPTTGQLNFAIIPAITADVRTYIAEIQIADGGTKFTHSQFIVRIQNAFSGVA